MTTVGDIFGYLCEIAPPSLAEGWDNVGLLCGDKNAAVQKALIALDITTAVAKEAAAEKAALVVSHHPVIFTPLKTVTAQGSGAAVWALASHSVSAVCMHTNLDISKQGVNQALADALGLKNTCLLEKTGGAFYKKVAVFVPQSHAEAVRKAMAAAGAGLYDGYAGCAFAAQGHGFFTPLEGSSPYIGRTGREESVEEVRIEAVCRAQDVGAVVSAMRKAHPYEVPAYDIFADEALADEYGLGLVGECAPAALDDFAAFAVGKLNGGCARVCSAGKNAKIVAVCGGAEDGKLIECALRAGADTLVVGEIKHHRMIEALEKGLNIIEAGHFATENVICPRLLGMLSQKFSSVLFTLAEKGKSPCHAVTADGKV